MTDTNTLSKNANKFVHLHTHSDQSLLDGFSTIPELLDRAQELGQNALGISDHGNLHGSYELYIQAKARGMKPVIGLEAYVAPGYAEHTVSEPVFFNQGGPDDVSGKGAYTHMLLFAENNVGLKNLFALTQLSYTEGFYRKPRISVDLLRKYGEGIIGTTGCPSGAIQTYLRLGMYEKAFDYARTVQGILGKDNYFMELMNHDMSIDLETKVLPDLLRIAKELDIPLLATNDAHYAHPEDSDGHEHLLCIATGSKMSVPTSREEGEGGKTRFAFDGNGYYLKSYEEMAELFPEDQFPGALANTVRIAERCNVTIEPDDSLRPIIELPAGMTEEEYLKQQVMEGLARRLPDKVNDKEYLDRIQVELDVIIPKGYSNYFLVVSDFIRWAKFEAQPAIPMGPGRGSAAGSLLAYLLDITDADPIRHGLLFERFLNPERDSPPDIDVDMNDTDRDRVIRYVEEKYGKDKVSYVVTFGKILAKNAVKDTARILDMPYGIGDKLNKAMPDAVFGKTMPLAYMYKPGAPRYDEAEPFRQLVEEESAEDLIEVARKLEGRTRSTGVHAAAVIISSKPVGESVPLMMRQKDQALITQWDYPTAEHLGLLKVDFLGLRNLGIIRDAVQHVERLRGIKIDVTDLLQGGLDDPATYRLLQDGRTEGVFQVEGCLGGDTLVGGRPIRELYERFVAGDGPKVTTSFDLASGKRRHNKVLRVIQSGVKPVYRLVSESGRFIEATADHRFMTDNGWKRLGELELESDQVLVDARTKTLIYRECASCGVQTSADYKRASDRCYSCSGQFHSNPSTEESKAANSNAQKSRYNSGAVTWNAAVCVLSHTGAEGSIMTKKFSELAEEAKSRWSPDAHAMYDAASVVFEAELAARADLGAMLARARASHEHQHLQRLGDRRDVAGRHGRRDPKCPSLPVDSSFERIVSITALGEAMTYDISMEAPLNNFLGNGFMVHNSGMQSLLKLMQPTEFNDISAALSLYRPGPMGVEAHTAYALRKTGAAAVDYIHPELGPLLESILGETYQLIVYQEQIQLIAREMAGYSLGQADNLRRAMGKKKREILEAEFVPFQAGARGRGYSDEAIKAIWDVMVPFADYAFNKSHSVAYGLTTYMTAYLKANFPAEYMAALLSSVTDDAAKTAAYLSDCRKMGVQVLPPSVNESGQAYEPTGERTIRVGLKAVRGVGDGPIEALLEARAEGGKFVSVNDLFLRAGKTVINKRVLEGLAYAGAFDEFGLSRRAVIEQLPELLKQYQKANKKKPVSAETVGLFDFTDFTVEDGQGEEASDQYVVLPMAEYPRMDKLKLEREVLGLYVSEHPIDGLNIAAMASHQIEQLLNGAVKPTIGWAGKNQVPVRLAGIVTSLMMRRTKKGDPFAIIMLEDRSGSVECLVFPKSWEVAKDTLTVDGLFQVVGSWQKRDENDDASFIVDAVRPLEFSEGSGNLAVRLKLTKKQWEAGESQFHRIAERHKPALGEPGDEVIVSVKNFEAGEGGSEIEEHRFPNLVRRSPALLQEMQGVFGAYCVGRWLARKPSAVVEVSAEEGEESVVQDSAAPAPKVEEPSKPATLWFE